MGLHRVIPVVALDGVLEHGDNLGNVGALSTGDIQWMTAGRGVIHREVASRNERAHILQLWVNLPGELMMTGNRYQDLRAADRPVIERGGARIDLISGHACGAAGPALNNWPISGTVITLEPDQSLEHMLPPRDRAFLSVLSGEITVGGRAVRAGQTAWSDPVPQATMSAITRATGDGDQPSTVMVYSGQPIAQPVAARILALGPPGRPAPRQSRLAGECSRGLAHGFRPRIPRIGPGQPNGVGGLGD